MRNGVPHDHLKAIEQILGRADSITIAVAFLKSKGLQKITGTLTRRLNAGAKVEIFIGTDFCQTEPKALKDLLELSESHEKLTVWTAKPDPRSTFHPKTYLGVEGNTARVLIDSANITGGALGGNAELSLAWETGPDHPAVTELRAVFDGYRIDGRCEELDDIVLELYRGRFNKAEEARKRIEKEIADSDVGVFDLAKLFSLHAEFSADAEEVAALDKRRRDRRAALTVQRRIAGMAAKKKLSKDDRATFSKLFRDLVTSGDGHRHLWHSGDIHRRGQEALSDPKGTIALFSLGRDAVQLPPVEGYAKLRAPAGKIDGVGINMVTEILCTFAPKRYAVFNGNTADALRAIGADPPKSVTLFSAEAYARVCGVIEAVRRRIGGEDLSDADAFLNWIYQKKVKPSGK
ncbi:phospholipase D family protein [uncultured Sphingomonas sp.]|uniref:phospholipase D family protein n=1 Tax=uncultured Sphingomonas sp. TaxID=158754 RepID=UPI0025DD5FA6|nr:phospholipase D family protein [uncultured Sphingomonas sp.]